MQISGKLASRLLQWLVSGGSKVRSVHTSKIGGEMVVGKSTLRKCNQGPLYEQYLPCSASLIYQYEGHRVPDGGYHCWVTGCAETDSADKR